MKRGGIIILGIRNGDGRGMVTVNTMGGVSWEFV